MRHFKNFKTVVYIPEGITRELTPEKLEYDYAFIEKYVGLDKVYLETFRGGIVPKEQINMIRDFLEEKGVEVAGGITTVYWGDYANDSKQRIFGTVCYSNNEMREKIREVSRYTAELFDEIILDDFYFTNCTCDECIKKKGDRSWVDFRRDLLTEVSENLILKPAKDVNPNVKITIKYPNWRESFHGAGYLPGIESSMFDRIYTGTETRSPKYTDQHLPEYLSYALMSWVENTMPGLNGGGWLDTYQCWSTDRYLEQAYLTAFAKPQEIMLFMWRDLVDNRFTTALGLELGKIDKTLSLIGKPVGIKTYIPFESDGENHLEMRLGMQGIPVEMIPSFPETTDVILLTESSLKDEAVLDKLKSHLLNGGDAVVTTGFVSKCESIESFKDKWYELSEVKLSGRKNMVNRYMITDDDTAHFENCAPILFPDIQHYNNASWSLLNAGSEDYHSTMFIRSPYGKGRLYILAVPENHADLKKIPAGAFDQIKRVMNINGVYVTANNVSLFQYDDCSFIIYKYVKDEVHPVKVTIHVSREAKAIVDMKTGTEYPLRKIEGRMDMKKYVEFVTDVIAEPGIYRAFKIV